MHKLHVGYVLYRFPTLSETFITRELEAVHGQGADITIMSLLPPRRGLANTAPQVLVKHLHYVPGPGQLTFWLALLHYMLRKPGKLLRLSWELLTQPYPAIFPKLLVWRIYMFAKGIVAAYLLRDKGVDMLHTHFAAWPGAATVVAADLLGVSFSVTAGHGYDLYTPSTLLEFVVRHAAAVVTVAEQRRRAILQRCSELSVEDIPIIPCSIDVANFPLIEREETDIIRLLSVGRLIEPKGHEYLIQACAKLRERNIKFHCTIVGSGSVQAEQKLQRLVASLDLRKEISLAGALTFRDILELYQTHDIFVMPCVVAQDNTRDGTPVVFVEAAATGLPLISTPIGGIPEIVVDSVTGLLVPERNAVAVADAISELSGSLERRQYLGLSGRRLVEQKFDSISNANRLIEMFRRIAIRVSGVSE